MDTIRQELVNAAFDRVRISIHGNDIDKGYELRKKTILVDKYLTNDEKSKVISWLNETCDHEKVFSNKRKKRLCENCKQECLATLYCEHCIRNHLKAKFSNWTSENDDIDNLIQKCQIESLGPDSIVEWIPYNNLQNIKYLTKGRCSETYSAKWIGGKYKK